MKKSKRNELPLTSQWTLDAVNVVGKSIIPNIFLVVCKDTGSKGTGFLLSNGYIITNLHVASGKLENMVLIGYDGKEIRCSKWYFDTQKRLDLMILIPERPLEGGLDVSTNEVTNIGTPVHTWGHPLGYNGPSPLLTVGYLAGFKEFKNQDKVFRHLVVNGAFNKGNSGGALFKADDNKVIGIVVSKHVPLSSGHMSAIKALADNTAGINFTRTDEKGNQIKVAKSQMIADIFLGYRDLIQVMIGEAICISELLHLLRAMSYSFYQEGLKQEKTDPKAAKVWFEQASHCIANFLPKDPLLAKIHEHL